jgi:hypothetical protein
MDTSISVESRARMSPSAVLASTISSTHLMCGCCNRWRRQGWIDHPSLGSLCLSCSRAFDDSYNVKPTCPLCEDGDCPLHG